MDARRILILGLALMLGGCATLQGLARSPARPPPLVAAPPIEAATPASGQSASAAAPAAAVMAPIPNPPERSRRAGRKTLAAAPAAPPSLGRVAPDETGRAAIGRANRHARETSHADGFVGGVQVFAFDPGRVYEVWTAPLRVTTLTLAAGETIMSKAAGDTVRWQIGETTSGQGAGQRVHVMIKPLARGLETNLVLATSQRVYLLQLKSGPPETFNAAVTWDLAALAPPPSEPAAAGPPGLDPATPAGPLDARYRIEPKGRRPAWTPTAVMTDGVRTFLTFPPTLAASEAPALFVLGPGGESQMVNYRQQAGLWIVDRVVEAAELRIGDKPRQVVRIIRGDRS